LYTTSQDGGGTEAKRDLLNNVELPEERDVKKTKNET